MPLRRPGPWDEPPGSAPVRVLVCDDHELYLLGLRALLSDIADVSLVAETPDPTHALTLVLDMAPDVVLIGQALPDGAALTLTRQLVPHSAEVVLLAESDAEADVIAALQAGARGYLTRRTAAAQLVDGIRAVACRQAALDGSVAGYLVRYFVESVAEHSVGRAEPALCPGFETGEDNPVRPEVLVPSLDLLTDRQRSVALLVAQGLSNAEIAGRLYLSLATVKSHLTIILRRLALRDRTQLAILVNRSALNEGPSAIWG